jgi:hypothetical protein
MTNSTVRREALTAAARALIVTRGLDVTEQWSLQVHGDLAHTLAAAQGCTVSTARHHIVKAARQLRHERAAEGDHGNQ